MIYPFVKTHSINLFNFNVSSTWLFQKIIFCYYLSHFSKYLTVFFMLNCNQICFNYILKLMNYKPIDPQPHPTHYKLSIRKNREMLRQSIHLMKLRKSAQLAPRNQMNPSPYIQSSKLLKYPPHNMPDRYIYRENEPSSNKGLCGCFSDTNQNTLEIYISPSQVISRKQFLGDEQCYYCVGSE